MYEPRFRNQRERDAYYISKGHTKIIVDTIEELTGADIWKEVQEKDCHPLARPAYYFKGFLRYAKRLHRAYRA